MELLNLKDMSRIILIMADTVIQNEVPFCELDSVAGDGDFGMSLSKGFRQLKLDWPDDTGCDIGRFLLDCGKVITEFCGGASGPIWGSAFRAAGKYAQGRETLDVQQVGELLQEAITGITKRGGAKAGDKTLLDALIPAADSMVESGAKGCSLPHAFADAAQAAVQGAERTKSMVASRGRASYVGERSLNYPDAGATAIGILFTEIAKGFAVS